MYDRVLVTLDGSSFSEAILPEVSRLVAETPARVHLLTVAEDPKGTAAYMEKEPLAAGIPAPGGIVQTSPAPIVENRVQATERLKGESRAYLEGKAEDLRTSGLSVETSVRFGDAVEQIVGYAGDHYIQLIMMATHGHTGLARLVVGSVTERIIASRVCPVLLVRPDRLNQD